LSSLTASVDIFAGTGVDFHFGVVLFLDDGFNEARFGAAGGFGGLAAGNRTNASVAVGLGTRQTLSTDQLILAAAGQMSAGSLATTSGNTLFLRALRS